MCDITQTMYKPEITVLINKLNIFHRESSSKGQNKTVQAFVDVLKTHPVTKLPTGHDSCSL